MPNLRSNVPTTTVLGTMALVAKVCYQAPFLQETGPANGNVMLNARSQVGVDGGFKRLHGTRCARTDSEVLLLLSNLKDATVLTYSLALRDAYSP